MGKGAWTLGEYPVDLVRVSCEHGNVATPFPETFPGSPSSSPRDRPTPRTRRHAGRAPSRPVRKSRQLDAGDPHAPVPIDRYRGQSHMAADAVPISRRET
jgi:hypothetical protein